MIKVADIKGIGFKKTGRGVYRLDTETKHFFWDFRKRKSLFVYFTGGFLKEGLVLNMITASTEGGISAYQLKEDGDATHQSIKQYKVENIKCISDMWQLVDLIIQSFPKLTY